VNNLKPETLLSEDKEWYVYIILCSDTSLYTGITTDVERRFAEHANDDGKQKGAKYFRARAPKEIVYVEAGHTRSTASQREAALKRLSRSDKLSLIDSTVDLTIS